MPDDMRDTAQIAGQVIDAELERSLLTTWNAKVIDYDNSRYPFNEWFLKRVQGMGYKVTDLQYLHEGVPLGDVYKVTKQLCADTNLPEFRRLLNRFVREVLVVKGELRFPVGVQRFMNVRVMLPDTPESIFPFHTGLLYGHGIASRSIWMPFTDVSSDADRSASMQILSIEKSRDLVKYATDNRLSIEQMSEIFGTDSWQIKAGPGSCCLFTQENIHGSGSTPNTTGKTRVSMDFRVAEAIYGDLLARKIPAGYFHVIPETEEEEERLAARPPAATSWENGHNNLFYINNNTSSTYGVPAHLQRYMLYEYCQKKNLPYHFELFELEDMNHLPTLWHIVDTRKCNIIMYSIFALSEDAQERRRFLEATIAEGLMIHFVNEDLQMVTKEDVQMVEDYLRFAKFGHSRMPIGLPLSDHSKRLFTQWAEA
jgi:sporadic carbohydrate cluster protein (TIGR04323 family)